MVAFIRKLALSAVTAGVVLALGASPTLAKTSHHHKHHTRTHHTHHAKAAKGGTIVRIAQEHLTNLGYYSGTIDGIMGKQTKTAIKRFQKDHSLKADGVLGSRTNRALELADTALPAAGIMGQSHYVPQAARNSSDISGEAVNQDFETTMPSGGKPVASRFAHIDVSESVQGVNKTYDVRINDQPILTVDGQPSVIGISPTYNMGDEDAVIFTTYSPNNPTCTYKTTVLALNSQGNKLLDAGNCTRGYQAQVNNNSLYITFPEHDDNRAVGATWRLEGMNLERL